MRPGGCQHRGRSGVVLLLALWTLSLLTVLAVTVGVRVQQKMTVLSRLEKREKLHQMALAGVARASAVLRQEAHFGDLPVAAFKAGRHNNPDAFQSFPVGEGTCEVSYWDPGSVNGAVERYGMTDEESRININRVPLVVLERLFAQVSGLGPDEVRDLAAAVLDWRTFGQSQIDGFYSEDYYENLQVPYPPKKADFETFEELLLVRGMTPEIYQRVLPFVTIYGQGQVNLNTAPSQVLFSLGMPETLIAKVLMVRRGPDGLEATADDHMFRDLPNLVINFVKLTELDPDEMAILDELQMRGILTDVSSLFRVQSMAKMGDGKAREMITSVIDRGSGRIMYWSE